MDNQGQIAISSLVVYTKPEQVQSMADKVAKFAGAEVYAVSEEGKIVVVLETYGKSYLLESVEGINNLKGVISTSLVYHQNENIQAQCEDEK